MLGLLIIGIVIYLLYSVSGQPSQNTTIDTVPISAKVYDIATNVPADNGGATNSIVIAPVVTSPASVLSSPVVAPAVSSTPAKSVDSVSSVTKVKFADAVLNPGDFYDSTGKIIRV